MTIILLALQTLLSQRKQERGREEEWAIVGGLSLNNSV